jgi:ABC-type phosphate transport system ATPase subunit
VPSLNEAVESSLRRVALWDEVKDKLHQSAFSLSGSQQQRFCSGRAQAGAPEVLLLDETSAALDPIATSKLEYLLFSLKDQCRLVIVTTICRLMPYLSPAEKAPETYITRGLGQTLGAKVCEFAAIVTA